MTVVAALLLLGAACAGKGDESSSTRQSNSTTSLPSPDAPATGGDVSTPAAPSIHDAGSVGGPPPVDPRTPGARKRAGPTTTTKVTATTTTTPGLPPEKCPDAKRCRRYIFSDGNSDAERAPRWPAGPDGVSVVRYNINPFGSGLPDDRVRGAVEAAFATWQAAAPGVRFVFTGFTTRTPTLDDGYNDIGFTPSPTYAFPKSDGRRMVEADMLLAASPGDWTWEPCRQRDGSCTTTCVENEARTGCRAELQSVVTHEAGHWLWLGDMTNDETDRELTMSPRFPDYDRWRSTLALGDVLGLRALYPCSCPLPPIYSP